MSSVTLSWIRTPGVIQVFLFALVVRLVVSLTIPAASISGGDAADYDRLAHAIVNGEGYVSETGQPTSMRPPLYGYVLAGFYELFSDGPAAMRVLQAILDAVTCALVYGLTFRYFGLDAARIAGLLSIFSLSLLFATRHLLAETFMAFFMVAIVYSLDIALTSWRLGVFLFTGVLVGLSTLTKGTTLPLPAMLLLPIWASTRWKWRPTLQAGAILFAGFLVVLLPWTVRNYLVHGEVVPVTTQVGWIAYSSYAPPEGRIFGVYTFDETVEEAMRLPEAERSRELTDAAVGLILEQPSELPRLLVLKFLYFFSPFDWEILGGDGVFNFLYALTLPLALYGLWGARTRGWRLWLLATPPAFVLALSLVLYGSPRLRLPVEPILTVLAAGGVVGIWERVEAQRTAFTAMSVLFFVVGFAIYWFSAEAKVVAATILQVVGLW